MAQVLPNKKYDHAFAIIRVDLFCESDTPPEQKITVVKVVWDQQRAEEETERLNRLNGAKGAQYFWQVARLERRSDV